jgi:hypothetical protein
VFGDARIALEKVKFLQDNHIKVSKTLGEESYKTFQILEYAENKNKEFIYKKTIYNTRPKANNANEPYIKDFKDCLTLEDLDNVKKDPIPICVYCDCLITDNNRSEWSTPYGKGICVDCCEKGYFKNINKIVTNIDLLQDMPKEYVEKALYFIKASAEDNELSEEFLNKLREKAQKDIYWVATMDTNKEICDLLKNKIDKNIDWENCYHQLIEKFFGIERNSPIE